MPGGCDVNRAVSVKALAAATMVKAREPEGRHHKSLF